MAIMMTMEPPNGLTRDIVRARLRDLKMKNLEIAVQAHSTTDELELMRLWGKLDRLTEEIQETIALYRRLPKER